MELLGALTCIVIVAFGIWGMALQNSEPTGQNASGLSNNRSRTGTPRLLN
jgi:hypothetical protein